MTATMARRTNQDAGRRESNADPLLSRRPLHLLLAHRNTHKVALSKPSGTAVRERPISFFVVEGQPTKENSRAALGPDPRSLSTAASVSAACAFS